MGNVATVTVIPAGENGTAVLHRPGAVFNDPSPKRYYYEVPNWDDVYDVRRWPINPDRAIQ